MSAAQVETRADDWLPTWCPTWCKAGHRLAVEQGELPADVRDHMSGDLGVFLSEIRDIRGNRVDRPGGPAIRLQLEQRGGEFLGGFTTVSMVVGCVDSDQHDVRVQLIPAEARQLAAMLLHMADLDDFGSIKPLD